ncbi:MAG TPA: hypothetical protein PKD12_05085 [Nitrospira sp.]|nr:hypothetical protein [Nitrospira sp.]
MDMSMVFLLATGFLTCALVAGLFQTVNVAVTRRTKDKRSTLK